MLGSCGLMGRAIWIAARSYFLGILPRRKNVYMGRIKYG
jgi:hypothetical protein